MASKQSSMPDLRNVSYEGDLKNGHLFESRPMTFIPENDKDDKDSKDASSPLVKPKIKKKHGWTKRKGKEKTSSQTESGKLKDSMTQKFKRIFKRKSKNSYVVPVPQEQTSLSSNSNDLHVPQEQTSLSSNSNDLHVPQGQTSLSPNSNNLNIPQGQTSLTTFSPGLTVPEETSLNQHIDDIPVHLRQRRSSSKQNSKTREILVQRSSDTSKSDEDVKEKSDFKKTASLFEIHCNCEYSRQLKKKIQELESEKLSMMNTIEDQHKTNSDLLRSLSNAMGENVNITVVDCQDLQIGNRVYDREKLRGSPCDVLNGICKSNEDIKEMVAEMLKRTKTS
ncbi:micronuclear linker histone polyprotein-like [Argopecten irradians]|uniref:micronuclear linker histone polyprotein-like n=1 Tax=Argopecten irradians TaxID=31199 RepID=UPI00372072AE